MKALKYFLFLIFLCLIFFMIDYLIKKFEIKIPYKINKNYFTYFYILFFALISGFLLLFGFQYFNKLLLSILKNKNLAEVASSSIVIAFSFLYSAYFQSIIEKLFDVKITINVWKNITGYILGRLTFIIIVYYFF